MDDKDESSRNTGIAISVPIVPGAMGDKPAPKPNENKCIGLRKTICVCVLDI